MRKVKKLISVALSAAMLLSVAATPVSAEEASEETVEE